MRVFRATIWRVVLSTLLLLKMSVSGSCCCSRFASTLVAVVHCATSCDCCCSEANETNSCCHPTTSDADSRHASKCGVSLPGCSTDCDCDVVERGRQAFLSRATEKGFENPSGVKFGFLNASETLASSAVLAEKWMPSVECESTHNNRQARLCVWRN